MRKLKQFVVFLCLFACLSAHAGQVTGLIQSAGGTPLSNASLTFTPTMFSIVAGSFVQTAASVPCYTDALGNVVGLPNPLVNATAAAANSGSLTAATTYYLQFTYWVGATETAPSPEFAFFLPGGQSSINITAPALQPTGATGYKVYASTTPGGEKLQQTVTGFGNTSITSLLSVTSVTSSNNTVCSFNFSDSLIPQARYVLAITDSSGSQVPGWPQTYYMQGSTFNLNTAFPTANTTAIFQNAIVSTPSGGVTQSIFGGLTLNGFPFAAGKTTLTPSQNGIDVFSGTRQTDTGPTGNFLNFKSLAGISLFSIDINGNATANSECVKSVNGLAVVNVSASCGYTTWALALAACPSTGCILDGTAPDVPLALGAFDTGSNTKPVTVRLGPYNFTATQITVRQGLDFGGSNTLSTNITSVGTNAQQLFVNPQVNNNAITVKIHDLSINALAGNTSQDGFFFDCSTLTNAGVELSRFDNLIFNGFKGAVVHFKATQDGASGSIGCTQGNTFANITAIRPTGATGATQNALRIEGGAGQFDFYNCWFDGQSSDTGTNVFVGSSGTQAPYSIHFHSTTNQNGFAYLFDGGTSITTEDDHLEVIKGVYLLKTTAQLLVGVNIKRPHINSNVGLDTGSGYIVKCDAAATNVDVTLDTPLIYANPDKLVNNLAGNACTVKLINARTFNSATPTNVFTTVGSTGTLTPAASVDLKGWNSVQVSTSGTSMSTFRSNLSPGEIVTLYATGGTIQFATGGNLTFGSQSSPLIIQSGDSATFMRVDAGTPAFVLLANPSKPTLTLKKGSGTPNYTSASTTYVVMDATNLCYTVTIPTGWKLSVTATAEMESATAAVNVFLAISDNAACSTANAGIIAEEIVAPTTTATSTAGALTTMITGDGASHNVALQFKTSAGADSVVVVNASASRTPMMTFNLSPSN